MDGTKSLIMEGTKLLIMEGTPPLTGRALPNLINAVSMLKSTSKSKPHWLPPR